MVDDRRVAVDPEDAVVVHRERPAGEVGGGQAPRPGGRGLPPERRGQFGRGHQMGVPDDGHDEPSLGLRGKAQVHVSGDDDLVALDVRVQLGVTAQAGHGEPGRHREQADRGLRCLRGEFGPRGQQAGRVRVHPDRRLGDLTPRAGQLVRRRFPGTADRDPDLVGGLAQGRDRLVHVAAQDQVLRAGASEGERWGVQPPERYLAYVFIVFFAVLAGFTFNRLHLSTFHVHPVSFAVWTTALVVIISTGGLGWTENGNDYSRYLPRDTPSSRTFWAATLGGAIPSIILELLGVFAFTITQKNFVGITQIGV